MALSLTDITNPYRIAAIQGRVVEVRSDEGCHYMDPISFKYTGAPFPSRGPDRVCFVIAVQKAAQRTLSFVHSPATDPAPRLPPAYLAHLADGARGPDADQALDRLVILAASFRDQPASLVLERTGPMTGTR